MYPRYHMFELARQVRQAQRTATQQPEPENSDIRRPYGVDEAGAVWRMGILLLVIAAILAFVFWFL